MTNHEFTIEGAETMYNATCDECSNVIHMAIETAKNEDNEHSLATAASLLNFTDIRITVGNNAMSIPNNADFLEMLFIFVEECLKSS